MQGTVRRWDADKGFGFIQAAHSSNVFFHVRDYRGNTPPVVGMEVPNRTLRSIVDEVEKNVIEKVLSELGSTRKAAKALGVDQSTIVKKAKRIGIRLADENMHH